MARRKKSRKRTVVVIHRAKSSRFNKRKWPQRHKVSGKKRIAKSINKMHPDINERQASHLVDMTLMGVGSNIKSDKRFNHPDLGTFRIKRTKARKSRIGRNPFTGETIRIKSRPARNKIVFRPAKPLLKSIN